MLAHHLPSFHQSLLSGFDPVGATPAPLKDWSRKPTDPAAVTVGVWIEDETLEPAELEAVTATRIVVPRSAAASVYVVALAPAISAQLPPPVSQRRH